MESITACLAQNIRNLRKQREWTQKELAKKAGISLIFLQGIESEKKWISPQTVGALSKALHVSQAHLFISNAYFDHIPEDVFGALVTTCKHPSWEWESIRWIIEGFARNQVKK